VFITFRESERVIISGTIFIFVSWLGDACVTHAYYIEVFTFQIYFFKSISWPARAQEFVSVWA
jgi:hypothetical protein